MSSLAVVSKMNTVMFNLLLVGLPVEYCVLDYLGMWHELETKISFVVNIEVRSRAEARGRQSSNESCSN